MNWPVGVLLNLVKLASSQFQFSSSFSLKLSTGKLGTGEIKPIELQLCGIRARYPLLKPQVVHSLHVTLTLALHADMHQGVNDFNIIMNIQSTDLNHPDTPCIVGVPPHYNLVWT